MDLTYYTFNVDSGFSGTTVSPNDNSEGSNPLYDPISDTFFQFIADNHGRLQHRTIDSTTLAFGSPTHVKQAGSPLVASVDDNHFVVLPANRTACGLARDSNDNLSYLCIDLESLSVTHFSETPGIALCAAAVNHTQFWCFTISGENNRCLSQANANVG